MADKATTNGSANADATRGLPYYEKLRKDLRATLEKKRLLDKNIVCAFLAHPLFTTALPYRVPLPKMTCYSDILTRTAQQVLEDQIFRQESSYLEDTPAGNIIKGFDNYVKGTSTAPSASAATNPGTATRRKGQVLDADRLFSKSSVSYQRDISPGPKGVDA